MKTIKSQRVHQFTQKYLSYPFEDEQIRLPLLHVRLKNKKNGLSLRTTGLVDSGATTTFIPTDLAEALDLESIGEEKSIGAGGEFNTWITEDLVIEILKGSKAAVSLYGEGVQVPDNPDAIPYVILGRDLLFKIYDITFQENQLRTVLKIAKE